MLLCMPVTPVLIKHKDGKGQKLFWLFSLIETECSITDSQLSVQLQHKLPRQVNFSAFPVKLPSVCCQDSSPKHFPLIVLRHYSPPAQAIYQCKLNFVLSCWLMNPVAFSKCDGKASPMVNLPIGSLTIATFLTRHL